MTLLNAVLNALSDSYPSEEAMTEMESLALAKLSAASSMRQRVRYSIGDVPTIFLNLRVKAVRDMAEDSANDCTVQRRAGSACIHLIAALTRSSARAARKPGPPFGPSAMCSRKA